MAIDGILTFPPVIKVKTTDKKEHYLNGNMVVAYSPSKDDEKMTDIVMLNGQTYTVNETPSQLINARYSRDVRNGSNIINFLG